jgi:hypothetical protein
MTANAREQFFLLIGPTWKGEAATDKLRASGIPYEWKRLNSSPQNWESILSLVQQPSLMGIVAKLGSNIYDLIATSGYSNIAQHLFQAIGNVAHAIFIHEDILREHFDLRYDENNPSKYWAVKELRDHFPPLSQNVREIVSELFETCRINVVPYRTNAELSVLATAFIDDHEKNLLFRVYVPSGRLFATEADKLLSLFQDWLNRVGRHNVRQGGYRTSAGEVYEFFGDPTLAGGQLSREFDDFSGFLDLCIADASAAGSLLSQAGIDRASASDMVMRYGKEVRRLYLDLRQQREARMLAIRHTLESELVEGGNESFVPYIDGLIEKMVPGAQDVNPMRLLILTPPEPSSMPAASVTINQQVINTVSGAVIQNVQGTVNLGPEAKELLRLVGQFGGQDTAVLESAVHELEDRNARVSDRLGARARLKGFLIQLGGKIEDTALAVLQNYVQTKIGLLFMQRYSYEVRFLKWLKLTSRHPSGGWPRR